MQLPSPFVLLLLLFVTIASMKSHSLKASSYALASSDVGAALDFKVAMLQGQEQRFFASSTQARNPQPPGLSSYRPGNYRIYKGMDFTIAYGLNYFQDNYDIRVETPYSDALLASLTPLVSRAFSAKLEIPIGKHFRLGTGVDFLAMNREFAPPSGLEVNNSMEQLHRHQTVQIPVYLSFDHRINRFSVGAGVGVALRVFQRTSGPQLLEDFAVVDAATRAGRGFYKDYPTFRAFAELRGEYRITEKFGLVARVGYQFSNFNELNLSQSVGVLKTPSVQFKVGVNYVIYCN